MAYVESGADGTKLIVDPTSKAARVTLYNSAGQELNPPVRGVYMLPINIRFTAAVAADADQPVWSIRVDAAPDFNIYIRRIFLRAGFDGTAAASTVQYLLQKFSTTTPTGGNALTPVPLNAGTYPASNVTQARQTAGAAVLSTAVTVDPDGHFAALLQPHQNGATGMLDMDFAKANDPNLFLLGAGEGLGIFLSAATVIGDTLGGYVSWEER